MKTLILGGGLTGITLARLLSEQGEDVLVLEQEQQAGVLCRSNTVDGFTFDTGGSHIIFSRDTEVISFIHAILGENRGERERNTKILYKGRHVKYPFENALSELPPEDCYTCLHEFIKILIASERGVLPPIGNFRDWICQTFGDGIADAYLIPYNTKIWNYPPEKMSAHWVEGRVPRPPVEDILKSAVGIATEGYTHQAVFSYPVTGGIEALIHAMMAPVSGQVNTRFRVQTIREVSGGYEVSDGEETVFGDRLISTIPLQNLVRVLSDIPETVFEAVSSLKYNAVVTIGIGKTGEVPPYSWAYIPDPFISKANRISFPSNFSDTTAPSGCSSVLAEITYNPGDSIDQMTDDEIKNHVIGSLSEMGILLPGEVKTCLITRNEFAYVVYDLDYIKNIRLIHDYFQERGISLIGRFSRFEYLNMDGIIRSVLDFVKVKE